MKKRLLILMTVTGMIILLGGLLTYGLGVHEIIPVPRPDLIVVGTSLIGILLIVSGVCDLFVKKTKEMEIEENDERNISLSNAAMASGFKVMNVTIAVSIFALIFTGYMTVVPCFTIIGAYAILPRKPGLIAPATFAGSTTRTATMWGAPPPTVCGTRASTFPKPKQSPATLFSLKERMIRRGKVMWASTLETARWCLPETP